MEDLGNHIHMASQVAKKMPSFTSWIKTIVGSLFGIGGCVGLAMLLWYCRNPILTVGAGCLRRFRNRLQKRAETVELQSVNREEPKPTFPEEEAAEESESVRLYPDHVAYHRDEHLHQVTLR